MAKRKRPAVVRAGAVRRRQSEDSIVAQAAHLWVEPLESRVLLSGGTITVVIKNQDADNITDFRLSPTPSEYQGCIFTRNNPNENYFIDDWASLATFAGSSLQPHRYAAPGGEFFVEIIRNSDNAVVDYGFYAPGVAIVRPVSEPGSYRIRCTTTVQVDEEAVEDTGLGGSTPPSPSWRERPENRTPLQLASDDPQKGQYEFALIESSMGLDGHWHWTYTKRYNYTIINTTETYVDSGESDTAFVCLPIKDAATVQALAARVDGPSQLQTQALSGALSNAAATTAVKLGVKKVYTAVVGGNPEIGGLIASVVVPVGTAIYAGSTPNADLGETWVKAALSTGTGLLLTSGAAVLGLPAAATVGIGFVAGVALNIGWNNVQENQLRAEVKAATNNDLRTSRDAAAGTASLYNQGGELRNVRLVLADSTAVSDAPIDSIPAVARLLPGQKLDFADVSRFFLDQYLQPTSTIVPMIEYDRVVVAGFKTLRCRVPWVPLAAVTSDTTRPAVPSSSIVVNEGQTQRSHVDRLDLRFSEFLPSPITLDALKLYRNGTEEVPLTGATLSSYATDQATLDLHLATLPEGEYELRADPSKVTDWFGNTLDAGASPYVVARFHKLYGDVNGDKSVDAKDLAVWKKCWDVVARQYEQSQGQLNYDPNAELTLDGKVDLADKAIINGNFGRTLVAPAKLAIEENSGAANDSKVDCGIVVTGLSSAYIPITLRNTGGKPLAVSAIMIEGADAGSFSLRTNSSGFTIEPGWARVIEVKFTPGQQRSYAANLVVYSNDASSPTTMNLSGVGGMESIEFSLVSDFTLPGLNPLDVKVFNGAAYIASDPYFDILDVSNPNAPVRTLHEMVAYLGDLDLIGNRLFVGAKFVLRIYDISNPLSPQKIGTWSEGGTIMLNFSTDAALAAIMPWDTEPPALTRGLQIVDVSNPNSAVRVGSLGEYHNGSITGGFYRSYLFASLDSILQVIDLRVPSQPTIIHSYTLHGAVSTVQVRGNFAYVTSGNYFSILDLSNPESPIEIGACLLPKGGGSFELEGTVAVISLGDGLVAVDFTDQTRPRVVGRVSATNVGKIDIAGDYVYVGGTTLRIFRMSHGVAAGSGSAAVFAEPVVLSPTASTTTITDPTSSASVASRATPTPSIRQEIVPAPTLIPAAAAPVTAQTPIEPTEVATATVIDAETALPVASKARPTTSRAAAPAAVFSTARVRRVTPTARPIVPVRPPLVATPLARIARPVFEILTSRPARKLLAELE